METYRIVYQKRWPKPTDAALKHFVTWTGSSSLWSTSSRHVADTYCAVLNLANQGADLIFEVYVMD